jgi:hypothetical protein
MERFLEYSTYGTQVGKFALLGQSGRLGAAQGHLAFLNSFLLATEIRTEHKDNLVERCFLVSDVLLAVIFVQAIRPILPARLADFLDLAADLSWSTGCIVQFYNGVSLVNGASLTYALVETGLRVVPFPNELRMVVGVGAGVVKIHNVWQSSRQHGL